MKWSVQEGRITDCIKEVGEFDDVLPGCDAD